MKAAGFRSGRSQAISPIIATALIIAVTLIAAVAIGGFVFGLFGSATNTAQVQTVNAAIKSSTVTSTSPASIVFTCIPASTSGALAFSNLGTISANALSLSITFGGTTYSGTAPSPCALNSGSSLALSFTTLGIPSALPPSGTQYAGYVVLSNGAQVVFTGAFLWATRVVAGQMKSPPMARVTFQSSFHPARTTNTLISTSISVAPVGDEGILGKQKRMS